MIRSRLRPFVGLLVLGIVAILSTPSSRARAQTAAVDPEAVETLKYTTDFLNSLQQFSVKVLNLREDLLDGKYRVDSEIRGRVTVRRPNRLRGERLDEDIYEILFYDGETVTVYDPREGIYVQEKAPPTIDQTLQLIYQWADLYPVSDLIWQGAFPLLMHGVTVARVIGVDVIDGVPSTHLLFSRPDVEFQIWVPVAGPPLPVKYVVTDNGTPAKLSIVAYLTDWVLNAAAPDSYFTFVPPEGAKRLPTPEATNR